MADKPNTSSEDEQGINLVKGSSLANLLDNAYIVIGLDGTIIEVNDAAQHMLGRTQTALVGQDFFSFWAVPNMGSTLVDQVISERLVKGFETDILRGEDTFIGAINAQLVINQQDYSKVIECLVTDTTASRKRQDDFEETLRTVTGGIAHVINNQMASVVGTVDLVKMELGDRPELSKQLDHISKSGIKASDVAHDLVGFADTSENLVMDEVYLTEVVADTKKYYEETHASEHPRNLIIQVEDQLDRVFGNEESLCKMLKHLLDNAVEATADNEQIIIKAKNVVLMHKTTGLNKKYVLVSVEDHGHGMDAETQKKIFEPFFSTRFAGRGMSLPKALKIIKKHNGQIRIKTGVGKGSIFKVYFPVID